MLSYIMIIEQNIGLEVCQTAQGFSSHHCHPHLSHFSISSAGKWKRPPHSNPAILVPSLTLHPSRLFQNKKVMAAMRFLPQALIGLLAFAMRIGGTKGLHSLWSLVGQAVSLGSKGAAARARAYTLSRRSASSQAAREARKRASRSSRQDDQGTGPSSSSSTHHNKERHSSQESGTSKKPRGGGRRSKHF